MLVQQIYGLVNSMTGEILGETGLVKEDLSNLVDIGKQVFDATSVENAARTLVDHIGKVMFVIRPYNGAAPSVYRDAWEYGSVLEKISAEIPEAQENESWELQDNEEYAQDIYKKDNVSAKFFNSKTTFEVQRSITDIQLRSAFDNASQMNSYSSMIMDAVQKSMSIKLDGLVMRTINNAIAHTINAEFTGGLGLSNGSGTRVINLLKLYNTANSSSYTFAQAILLPDFIRYATYMIGLYMDRMSKISRVFNIGGQVRYTPKDMQHLILLSDFAKASEIYLQSTTFHDELVKLRGFETVPSWQGTGTAFNDLSVLSKINVTIKSGDSTQDVEVAGVLGVLFDHDTLGVSNLNQRVTSHYNAKAEFTNTWYKADGSYFNDFNENMIVFVAC